MNAFRMPDRARYIVLVVLLCLELGALLFAAVAPVRRLERIGPLRIAQQTDFVAFYCGGDVARSGGDPYLDAPLRACEARVTGTSESSGVTPAPLPPYDLPLFEAVSKMQYARAGFFWLATLLLASAAAALLFEPVLALSALAVAALAFLGAGRDDYLLGQPPPVVLLSLAACTTFLARKNYSAAAVTGGVAMIEPHLGLPAMLGLFILVPQCRIAVTGVAVALGALCLTSVGLGGCIEYATRVLPAQVLAEVPNSFQYSTTYALTLSHTPAAIATKAGSFWYALMLVLGVWLAGRLARRFDDDAFVPLAPVMVAVLGGSYIHEQQLVALVPGAFLLVRHLRGAVVPFALALVAALAWEPAYLGFPMYTLVTLALVYVAFAAGDVASRRPRLVAAASIAVGYIALTAFDRHATHVVFTAPAAAQFASDYAWMRDLPEYAWGISVRDTDAFRYTTLGHAISKLPTWLGLAMLVGVAIRTVREPSMRRT